MTPENGFRFELEGGVGTVVLSRPSRLNALTFETYHELRAFLDLSLIHI